MFSNSSSIIRARRYREVYCRFEIRRTLRAAKDERHLLSCLMNVHHCLFLRPHHCWIHREHCEIENQKMKEAICFLPTLTSMSETTSTKILLFLSTGVFIISFGLLQEPSSLFFVDFIVVVEEIYTSVAWDFGDKFWTYNLCFLQLADCCFSCTMIGKLFSRFL